MRTLQYNEAIREATELCMDADERVYIMGLGVTDPKSIFGTTTGLEARFGSQRVLDMPVAENTMTGVGIGSALVGMRPIMVHQRIDFALLALDQLVNNAAKWQFMFAGQKSVPLVVRLLIGRGWGQGPQHSQSLQATFAHIPGLKVVMPTTPYDAKGMLIAAVEDPNPVIFIEHRWLHHVFGPVPEGRYTVPLSSAAVVREGKDVTIAATSLSVLESLRAADALAKQGIDAEVIDVRTLKPLDTGTILASVAKTGAFVAVDHGWRFLGFAGEVVATVAEHAFGQLKFAPRRVTQADRYVATSPALANPTYPYTIDIVNEVLAMFGKPALTETQAGLEIPERRDVPQASFRGPF